VEETDAVASKYSSLKARTHPVHHTGAGTTYQMVSVSLRAANRAGGVINVLGFIDRCKRLGESL